MMRILLSISIVVFTLVGAGCSSSSTGDISGTVTFQGKPVVSGTVSVIGPEGNPVGTVIQPDGTYKMTGIQTGSSIFLVASPAPAGEVAAAGAGKPGKGDILDGKPDAASEAGPAAGTTLSPDQLKKWVAIPNKYLDPNQTDLKFTVSSGANTFNIEMK